MSTKHLTCLTGAILVGCLSAFGAEDVWVATNLTERYDSSTAHRRKPTLDSAVNPQKELNGDYWASKSAYTIRGDVTDMTLYFTNEVERLQTLMLSVNTTTDYALGTIVGSPWHTFIPSVYGQSLSLRNALDFEGGIRLDGSSYSCNSPIIMLGDADDAEKPTGIHTLRTTDYTVIQPTLTNQQVILKHVYGTGLWAIMPYKDQAAPRSATVTIEDSQSGDANDLTLMRAAKVNFNGAPYETPALVGTPSFHLDASVASSLTVADGKVSEWRDLAGSGITLTPMAGTYEAGSLGSPTLRTDADSGLPVVDFGAFVGQYWGSFRWTAADWGDPSALQLSTPLENVRELFAVVRDKHGYNAVAQFFGGKDTRAFFRSYTAVGASSEAYSRPILFTPPSNADVSRAMEIADVRLDGHRTDATAEEHLADRLHTLSVGLLEPLKLGYLGHDENAIRYGGVQIAEVIAYSNALTSLERREVNAYLKKKWLVGDAAEDRDFGKIHYTNDSLFDRSVTVASGTLGVREIVLPSSSNQKLVKKGAGTLAFGKMQETSLDVEVQEGAVRFEPDEGDGATDTTQPAARPLMWFDASKADSIVWHDESLKEIERWKDRRDGTNYMGKTVYAAYERGRYAKGSGYVYKEDQTLADGTEVKKGTVAQGNGIGAYPTYVASDTVGGYPGVSFGKWLRPGNHGWGTNLVGSVLSDGKADPDAWATASYLVIVLAGQTNTAGTVREAFVVARPTDSAQHIKWFGTCTSRDLYADADGSTAYVGGNSQRAFSGFFTRNGVSLASGMTGTENKSDERACAAARFTHPTPLNGLGICGDGGQGAGSGIFNEVIYYDRVLSERERRQTEAYLMAKWGLGTHPFADRSGELTVPTLTFADGVDAVLDANRPVTVGSVASSDGTLVKKGTGAATVSGNITQTNVTVAAGTLAATVSSAGLFADAIVHFDASDLSTMDWAEETLASGEVVTNVTRWYDTRSRTLYRRLVGHVYSELTSTYFGAGRLPRLKRMETRTGSGRYIPVMDFGEPYYRNGGTPGKTPDEVTPAGCGENDDAALMAYADPNGADSSYVSIDTIREAFVIIHDNPATNGSPWAYAYRRQNIIGGRFSTNEDSFQREDGNSKGYLLSPNVDSGPSLGYVSVRDGYASVDDGEADHPRNIELPEDGFHLVWFSATNNARSGGLAFSRMRARGGVAVAELALFDHELTDAQRAAIKSTLMDKWFNGEASGYAEMGTVSVAKGAELDLSITSGFVVRPQTLANAGTLRMTSGALALAPGGELGFAFTAPKSCATLVQDQPFDLRGGGTFVIDFTGQRVRRGTYELIRASDILGTLSNWTLSTKGLNGPRNLKLRQTATSIVLEVAPTGAAVFVR